jgi:cbb3-type cytochrome c oxidase subunit III
LHRILLRNDANAFGAAPEDVVLREQPFELVDLRREPIEEGVDRFVEAAREILAQAADTEVLGRGKATFTAMCAACHGPDGGGVIGPNLTDDYWLHGSSPTAVHTTVANGVLAKGMPAWGKTLQPAELDAVVAYVISLHGTSPASPKAPEGVQEPPDAAPSGS